MRRVVSEWKGQLVVILAGLALGLPGLAGAQAAPAAMADDRELLLQLDRDFDKATAERGVEAWVSYFAENGSMLPATGGPVTGLAAIREFMAPAFANPDFSLRWQPTRAEVLIPGTLGYTLGRWERRSKNKEGKRELLRGSYVSVWRKQADGSWKIILDTGVPDGPPTLVE